MQLTKSLFVISIAAPLLFACAGNTSPNKSGDVSSGSASSSSSTGDDTYYEYTIASSSKKLSMNGGDKLYISSKGNMRMEQHLTQAMDGKTHEVSVVTIGQSDKPGQTILLDDDDKTYTVNKINLDGLNSGLNTSSNAVKIGEEKILGFNCVHARITSTQKLGSMSLPAETFDIWKSKDVPILPSIQQLMNQVESKSGTMYSAATAGQLKQMGCDGFLVKMTSDNKEATFNMELTKVDHRDIPASMFQIPDGYKENKE